MVDEIQSFEWGEQEAGALPPEEKADIDEWLRERIITPEEAVALANDPELYALFAKNQLTLQELEEIATGRLNKETLKDNKKEEYKKEQEACSDAPLPSDAMLPPDDFPEGSLVTPDDTPGMESNNFLQKAANNLKSPAYRGRK